MDAIIELFEQGGKVMLPILVLSILLYTQCFRLLFALRRFRAPIQEAALRLRSSPLDAIQLRGEMQDLFGRQRLVIGAMVAAAPLLGLLGTVSGMEKTFANLSGQGSDRSMEGLAQGISEVLVATESGLAVAIPALVFVYVGHRQLNRNLQLLTRLEREASIAVLS
jgi:biopolymer transport protein ExbB/TolQ